MLKTIEFVECIQTMCVPKKTYVSLDVSSLFTNIPKELVFKIIIKMHISI